MEATTALNNVRTWIYRSVKKLNPEEEAEITLRGQKFIQGWDSHGQKLNAEFKILHHHFLVFFVDQNWASASGCSIDKSVAFVREIEGDFQLGLLDRMQIPFKKGDEIVLHHFSDLKKLYEQGEIDDDTEIFDQLVQNASDFESRFSVPFRESDYYGIVK